MFLFRTRQELIQLSKIYPDDIVIYIDKRISDDTELREVINKAIESPYGINDNWDGIAEVLGELDWWTSKTIRIVNLDLPDLAKKNIDLYLSVLKENDDFLKNLIIEHNILEKKVIVYFDESLKDRVLHNNSTLNF